MAHFKVQSGAVIASLNVIPMADIMLVLLIIFMVVTPMEEISSRVRDRISGRLDKTVYIKSDARTKYGDVLRLVDQVRTSGVDNVGLLTDKIQARMPPPLA